MTNDVIVTLPVFVTTKLKVTTSPAFGRRVRVRALDERHGRRVQSGVDSVLSAATAPARVWPFTVAVLWITPASTSACID